MALDKEAILKSYPQYAWLLGTPEVDGVFQQAIDGSWDQGRFFAGLQATQWWKTQSPDVRKNLETQATDPGAIDESIQQRDAKLWDQAQSLGLNLNAAQVDQLSRQSVQFGWSDNQINDNLTSLAKQQGYQGTKANLGTTQNSIDTLKNAAGQFMVSLDDNTAFQWAQTINNGEHKVEDYNALLKDWAKAKFSYDPQMVERIDAGFTPSTLFTQQKSVIAKLLEVSDDQVNLNDQKWSQVLDYADPQSGQRRAMTESETAKLVRSTAEWRQTANGQQAGSDLAAKMTNMFQGR